MHGIYVRALTIIIIIFFFYYYMFFFWVKIEIWVEDEVQHDNILYMKQGEEWKGEKVDESIFLSIKQCHVCLPRHLYAIYFVILCYNFFLKKKKNSFLELIKSTWVDGFDSWTIIFHEVIIQINTDININILLYI